MRAADFFSYVDQNMRLRKNPRSSYDIKIGKYENKYA